MPKYVGLAIGGDGWDGLGPDEVQRAIERYMAWDDEVRKLGKLRGGAGLGDDAVVLRRHRDGVEVSDGPFAESKEGLGGYSEVEATDREEAIDLFRTHPHLDYGGVIEVREVTLD